MESMEIDSEGDKYKTWAGGPIEEGSGKSARESLAPNQVENALGGYVFETTDEIRLRRFLCLGTEKAIFHAGELKLTKDDCKCISRLIGIGNGSYVVQTIREFSVQNRACRADSILFALALCCRCDHKPTKKAAYKILSDVCRIPTHLFQFIKFAQEVPKFAEDENPNNGKGWGRAHRKGVSMWYHSYKSKEGGIPLLAYHMTKYKARFGLTHKDVFRMCHIKTDYDALGYLVNHFFSRKNDWQNQLDLAKQREDYEQSELKKVIRLLQVFDDAKRCRDEQLMKHMILENHLEIAKKCDNGEIVMRQLYVLVREHVPTSLLKSKEVWVALMRFMPMTAMIRNLGKMASLGLLDSNSFGENLTADKLTSNVLLKEAKIHPFTLLVAEKAYSKGQNKKETMKWQVNPTVRKALRDAFYLSFDNVEATGKRFLLAICMGDPQNPIVNGTPIITAREAAAAMALVTLRREQRCDVVAFSKKQSTEDPGITNLPISPHDDLNIVLDKCSKLHCDKINISAPIEHAFQNKKMYDVFVIYTDSVNESGSVHPSTALKMYRKGSGIENARLIVCGLASNGFTIADPNDRLMMDIVGFDSSAPTAIHQFVTENI